VPQRIYIGAGTHLIPVKAELKYKGPDSTGRLIDTTFSRKTRATRSIALHAGTYLPITLLSDQGAIALNIELLGIFSEIAYDSILIHSKAEYDRREQNWMIGVPISIDLKTGGEVSLSKAQKHIFGLGAGLMIGVTTASSEKKAESPLTAVPFIKAELGWFAGLAFKVRGTAYLASGSYDKTYSNLFASDELQMKLKQGYGYTLSLIVMPFSYGWRSEEWY
jgi:hypothetical protein